MFAHVFCVVSCHAICLIIVYGVFTNKQPFSELERVCLFHFRNSSHYDYNCNCDIFICRHIIRFAPDYIMVVQHLLTNIYGMALCGYNVCKMSRRMLSGLFATTTLVGPTTIVVLVMVQRLVCC